MTEALYELAGWLAGLLVGWLELYELAGWLAQYALVGWLADWFADWSLVGWHGTM